MFSVYKHHTSRIMEKSIGTLLKESKLKSEERWYPIPVENFRNGFSPLDHDEEGFHPLVDNLSYSLQYLQFLEKEVEELSISSVLYVMLYKTYIITGMGIIEGIFTNIIKSNGFWKQCHEETMLSTCAEKNSCTGERIVVKTEILKKVEPKNSKMTLDEMIRCLDKHHTALAVDHLIYPQLKRLKNFRNRVHLQMGEAENDHDYNAFDSKRKEEMQSILYEILCSPKVTDGKVLHHYDFLKPKQ